MLFDINGHPRKSPREHASTLAILSCLVQQRRKREKELNGGISPEKLNQMRANETDDDEEFVDNKIITETDSASKHNTSSVPISEQLVIKEECDPVISLPEKQTEASEQKKNIIRDADEDSNCSSIGSRTRANQPIEKIDTNIDAKTDIKTFPKIPETNYINPHQICRQIDDVLTSSYLTADDFDLSYDDDHYDMPIHKECDDLVLISTPKDFLEIVSSVAPGPLRYRSLVNLKKRTGLSSFGAGRGRKRRNNKTGWPSIPRRRLLIKKEDDDESTYSNTELEDSVPCALAVISSGNISSRPRVHDRIAIDITRRLETETDEYFINARPKLNSLGEDCQSKDDDYYSNDGRISAIFTTSSEKAENSDIFTVSSDSLDTADLSGAIAGTSSSGGNNLKINNKPEKEYDKNCLVHCSDESSADITLAEMLKKQIGVSDVNSEGNTTTQKKFKGTKKKHIPYLKNRKYISRIQNVCKANKTKVKDVSVAVATAAGTVSRFSIKQTIVSSGLTSRKVKLLQPIIRVKKINDKYLFSNDTRQHTREDIIDDDDDDIDDDDDVDEDDADEGQDNCTEDDEDDGDVVHEIESDIGCDDARQSNREQSPLENQSCDSNSRKMIRNNFSPKTQFSPPKLRKPRGRWYRER